MNLDIVYKPLVKLFKNLLLGFIVSFLLALFVSNVFVTSTTQINHILIAAGVFTPIVLLGYYSCISWYTLSEINKWNNGICRTCNTKWTAQYISSDNKTEHYVCEFGHSIDINPNIPNILKGKK